MHLLYHDQRQIIGMQYMCFVVIVGSANVNKLNKKCLEYTCVLVLQGKLHFTRSGDNLAPHLEQWFGPNPAAPLFTLIK